MFYNILVAIIAIICVLLIFVVLLQNGQGEGLSGIAGGGGLGGSSGLGARRTADLLSKATSLFGTLFLVLCVVANFAIDRGTVNRSILQDGSGVDVGTPTESAPAIPTLPPVDEADNSGSSEDVED